MGARTTFGSVRKLPSGRWQASYWHDGKRYLGPTTFTSKGDARAYLSAVETDVRRGGWIDPDAGSVTFAAYSKRWLLERHDLRPSTREDYEALLKVHLIPAFGDLAIANILSSKVRSWNAVLAKDHPARAAKGYRLLRTILGTAVTDRHLLSNPCQVKGGGVERAPERPIPSVPEVDALADAMPEHLRLLVLLAAWCGLRRGELLGLVRSDFDTLHGTVSIERAVTERADGTIVVGEPKTAAGRRTVAIPPHLFDVVGDHLHTHVLPEATALVFTNRDGEQLRPRPLQHAWNRARSEVGVAFHLHDLRHLGATMAAATGASTREIMRRIGHASPAAALRYQHATEDRDRVIAEALSELAPTASVVQLRRNNPG
jgi:integrase